MERNREWELTAKLWTTWLQNRSDDVLTLMTAQDVRAMIDMRNIVSVYCSDKVLMDDVLASPVDDAIAEAQRGR